MRTNDQRDMIEQLLGITEISAKAEVLKELLKNTRDSIKEEELRIQAVGSANKRVEQSITDIASRSKAWDKNKLDKVNALRFSLNTLQETDIKAELDAHRKITEITEKETKLASLKSDLESRTTSMNRSDEKLATLEANLQKAKDGVCPACEQSTAHLDTHEQYTKELQEEIKEEQKYNVDLVSKIREITGEIKLLGHIPDMPTTFYKNMEDALSHKHNVETLQEQIAEKELEQNPYIEQIEQLKESGLEEISYDLINEYTSLKEHQEFLYKLLTSKDSFIRKKIIDQNLQYLNYRLSHYLDKLGLPHDVKFNSDLTVDITEYGRDLDFDNLSRGERNRLILGMSWAFRDIYESLNQPMNLMCIDELVDSGMDTTGVENALAVLKKMGRESKKNVFLISHKEELQGRVNNVLYVVKEGGFTSYSNDIEIVDAS